MPKVGISDGHLLVITGETANKDGGVTSGDSIKGQTSIFKTLIGDLKHFSLLWIHPHCLNWSHVEEGWIKIFKGTVKKVPPKYIETPRAFEILVVMSINVETISRNF